MKRALISLLVVFMTACCTLQVTTDPVAKPLPISGGGGESAAHATASELPLFCPSNCPTQCPDCLACRNGPDDCLPVPCATAECTNGMCHYAATGSGSCTCYEGEYRWNGAKNHLEQCHFEAGIAQWLCSGDGCCTPVAGKQTTGCVMGDDKQVTECTKLHYWENSTRCDAKRTCVNGACVCPCTEAQRECSSGGTFRTCQDCAWVSQTCPFQSACTMPNAECKCAFEGEMRCVSPEDGSTPGHLPGTTKCVGGKWVQQFVCAPGTHCESGDCASDCKPDQRWCSKIQSCVPKCSESNCEVLNSSFQCQSRCPGICKNGQCKMCVPDGHGGELCAAGPVHGGGGVVLIPLANCGG